MSAALRHASGSQAFREAASRLAAGNPLDTADSAWRALGLITDGPPDDDAQLAAAVRALVAALGAEPTAEVVQGLVSFRDAKKRVQAAAVALALEATQTGRIPLPPATVDTVVARVCSGLALMRDDRSANHSAEFIAARHVAFAGLAAEFGTTPDGMCAAVVSGARHAELLARLVDFEAGAEVPAR